jgi:hypothetical protein
MTSNNRDWPVGLKGVVGIASCVMGLGVVYFGYGIGTESPKKSVAAQVSPISPRDSKRPVRAMNLALGNMVFFARDLGFAVKNAQDTPVDSSKIAARIEGQLHGIRQLYGNEIAKNSALAGSLILQIHIGSTGEVSQVREISSRQSDGEFKKAVAAQVSTWSFAGIDAENLQVTCPLLFVHEGMDITTLVRWEKSLGSSSEKPSLARAPGNPGSVLQANTAPGSASVSSAPASQRSAAKSDGKEFQIKYATLLRREPNFSAPSLTTFTIGTKVIVLRRQGDWLEVRSTANGPTGFIRKEFIAPVEIAHK